MVFNVVLNSVMCLNCPQRNAQQECDFGETLPPNWNSLDDVYALQYRKGNLSSAFIFKALKLGDKVMLYLMVCSLQCVEIQCTCVVPENIHTHPKENQPEKYMYMYEARLEFPEGSVGGGGRVKPNRTSVVGYGHFLEHHNAVFSATIIEIKTLDYFF